MARRDEPQQIQTVVEEAVEHQPIGSEADDPHHHQGIVGLVVRAVRRGVALLVVSQVRRIVGVVGHMHGLWAVAQEGAAHIGVQHVTGSLPDQLADLARPALLGEGAKPADVGHFLQRRQRGIGQVEDAQKSDAQQTHGHHRQPHYLAQFLVTHLRNEQDDEGENPGYQTEERPSALGEEDSRELRQEQEDVGHHADPRRIRPFAQDKRHQQQGQKYQCQNPVSGAEGGCHLARLRGQANLLLHLAEAQGLPEQAEEPQRLDARQGQIAPARQPAAVFWSRLYGQTFGQIHSRCGLRPAGRRLRPAHGAQPLLVALQEAHNRQRHGHDQIGGHEDGVAHVGGHAGDHVPGPGQGVQIEVLNHAIQRDW